MIDTQFILALAVLIVIGLICGYTAKTYKNRSHKTWFFLGLFFGLLALIVLLALPKKELKEVTTPSFAKTPLKTNDYIATETPPKTKALPMISLSWYYLTTEQEQQGPMSFKKLKNAFLDEKINESNYVWNESLEDWKTLTELPEYLDILKE